MILGVREYTTYMKHGNCISLSLCIILHDRIKIMITVVIVISKLSCAAEQSRARLNTIILRSYIPLHSRCQKYMPESKFICGTQMGHIR